MEAGTKMQTQVAPRFAGRVNRINISPTMAVLMESERMRAQGIDVVDFGPGEPDFPTPEHIKRAAVKALEENKTKYTPSAGIAPLRQAVCEWHAGEMGSSYTAAECIVTVGGKHALFNAMCALVEAGDEVIVPAPYWVSYPDLVKVADGTPVIVETRAEDNFCLRSEQLKRAATSRTRAVIANSPSNPTGGVIPAEEFARILEVCKQRSVWLVTDECYSHFVYGGGPFSVSSVPGAKETVIVAGSLSKTFAMTGWRCGYALAPQPVIAAMTKLASQSTSNPPSIVQYAALEALRGPMNSVATMLAEYALRREHIVAGLRAISGVTCATPQGAFYVFPNVKAHLNSATPDTVVMAKQLLDREHVAVVPGDAFGAPGHLRISYATSMERIDEGLRRIARFFSRAS